VSGSAEAETQAQGCYRHPATPTYISCQRCGRPICVQCQRPAAVGVHCPDCASGNVTPASNARGASGSAGFTQQNAQQSAQPRRKLSRRWFWMMHTGRQPVVTYTLIGLNVIIFGLQMIPGLDLTSSLLYAPLYSRAEYIPMGASYEPWRMLTSMFAHSTGSIFHILLNMYTLWIFGQVLESMLGRMRFLAHPAEP